MEVTERHGEALEVMGRDLAAMAKAAHKVRYYKLQVAV
jgi:hypothetical protein